jgi:hypothetical protein
VIGGESPHRAVECSLEIEEMSQKRGGNKRTGRRDHWYAQEDWKDDRHRNESPETKPPKRGSIRYHKRDEQYDRINANVEDFGPLQNTQMRLEG